MQLPINQLQALVDTAVNTTNTIFTRAAELEEREAQFSETKAQILAMLTSLATTPFPHRAKCVDAFKTQLLEDPTGQKVLFLETVYMQMRLLENDFDADDWVEKIVPYISPETDTQTITLSMRLEDEDGVYKSQALFVIFLLLTHYNFSYQHDGVFHE